MDRRRLVRASRREVRTPAAEPVREPRPDERPELAGRVDDPLTERNVLALQGTTGNRAVSAMIGRETHTTPAPAAAGGGDAGKFDLDWYGAVTGMRWEDAVRLAMNPVGDMGPRLSALGYEEISAFCAQASRMGATAFAVFMAAEAVRLRKLEALFQAALAAEQWEKLVTYLDGYAGAELLAKARLIKGKGDPKLAAAAAAAEMLWPDDNHRVRRTLSFIAVESLTGAAVRPATSSGVTGGTKEAAVKVPETGGSVTFSKGVSDGGSSDLYGLTYTGADAQKTGWIQFIARNIEKLDDTGKSLGFYVGTWTPQGQTARDFSTAAAPTWFLDTLSDQAPFYEASSKAAGGGQGLSDISPTKTAMYDLPAGRADLVAPLFTDASVKTVKSRASFDTYLVHETQVLRHETITVEYTFDKTQAAAGTDTAPKVSHTGGGSVSALPADRFKAMTARFPKFAYLPH